MMLMMMRMMMMMIVMHVHGRNLGAQALSDRQSGDARGELMSGTRFDLYAGM